MDDQERDLGNALEIWVSCSTYPERCITLTNQFFVYTIESRFTTKLNINKLKYFGHTARKPNYGKQRRE